MTNFSLEKGTSGRSSVSLAEESRNHWRPPEYRSWTESNHRGPKGQVLAFSSYSLRYDSSWTLLTSGPVAWVPFVSFCAVHWAVVGAGQKELKQMPIAC